VRTVTGVLTESLKIPVVTTLPCQVTSLGNPTFTDKIFIATYLREYRDYIGILRTLGNDTLCPCRTLCELLDLKIRDIRVTCRAVA
jgi:hypothetical protein